MYFSYCTRHPLVSIHLCACMKNRVAVTLLLLLLLWGKSGDSDVVNVLMMQTHMQLGVTSLSVCAFLFFSNSQCVNQPLCSLIMLHPVNHLSPVSTAGPNKAKPGFTHDLCHLSLPAYKRFCNYFNILLTIYQCRRFKH